MKCHFSKYLKIFKRWCCYLILSLLYPIFKDMFVIQRMVLMINSYTIFTLIPLFIIFFLLYILYIYFTYHTLKMALILIVLLILAMYFHYFFLSILIVERISIPIDENTDWIHFHHFFFKTTLYITSFNILVINY